MKHLLFLFLPVVASAAFPEPFNTETKTQDMLTPAEALARLKLPSGFRATLFASEPDVQNPIAMSWDARGRLWVVENYTYAENAFDLRLRDRVLIFADTDGDGRFDSRTVFTDTLQRLTSIEVGRGGVWLISPPQVLFVPDRDFNDVPDAPPEVVLDGFHVPPDSYHNFANGLRFGPDGWLYGRCGATASGEVGVPGTPEELRVPVRGGMWRYHPTRRIFETLTAGNTNPWGHDWDEHGQLFHVNTVNGHLWHVTPGAHFVRGHTFDPNPHVYELIDLHSDHWHFDIRAGWQDARTRKDPGLADTHGGGHVHIGTMIYLGDNWPAEYRGHLFTLNQHGRRANRDVLERTGSGYTARHRPDFFKTGDAWFLGLDIGYGPDGGVILLDWSDTGECHERDGVHRTSGRIFKITHGQPKPVAPFDLTRVPADELVKLHAHPNEWFVRQARLELARRADEHRDLEGVTAQLQTLVRDSADPVHQLRALWTLHVIGAADERMLTELLRHPEEHLRVWAIRLLTDFLPLDTLMSERPARFGEVRMAPDNGAVPTGRLAEFVRLAREDPSGLVRLTLASTLQRLPANQRAAIAAGLVRHEENAEDHNLPKMIWYGLIPLAKTDPASLAALATQCALPDTRRYMARRLAEDIERNPAPLNVLLNHAATASGAFQRDVLNGLSEAFTGWRKATAPAAWESLSLALAGTTDPLLRARATELNVLFGVGRALDEVKVTALDSEAELSVRKAALQTLIVSGSPMTRSVCEKLIGVRYLNPTAARGLAEYDDPAAARLLVGAYRKFHHTERGQLMAVLVSRPTFARALLEAVDSGKIPREAVTPFHVRQLRAFNDVEIDAQLARVWGELRETTEDRRRQMARIKAQLTPEVLSQASPGTGRALFNLACAACHRLHGEGGDIGPDLTGTGRGNLDYLLENIVDPGAVVPADYRLTTMELQDGRVLGGVITARTERTITVQTMTEKLAIERAEIVREQQSATSLMPEGLLDALTESQVRDLIAYLQHPSQLPLPAQNSR